MNATQLASTTLNRAALRRAWAATADNPTNCARQQASYERALRRATRRANRRAAHGPAHRAQRALKNQIDAL